MEPFGRGLCQAAGLQEGTLRVELGGDVTTSASVVALMVTSGSVTACDLGSEVKDEAMRALGNALLACELSLSKLSC